MASLSIDAADPDSPQTWLRKLHHELGNAVWAVSGYSEILQRAIHKEEGGQLERDLTSIGGSAARIQRLCSHMRLAQACRYPESAESEEGCDLAATYRRLRHQLASRDPQHLERLPPSLPAQALGLPEDLLHGLLLELFENSLEFTGGALELEVDPSTDSRGLVRLRLLDGPPRSGVVPEDQWASPFTGSAGRLGLGATLVSHLVTGLGGSLLREPRSDGEGSCWDLRLPGVPGAPAPDPQTPVPPPGEHTLLYVDDQPANRSLVRRALEARGWRVLLARDGQEGLDQIPEGHPDLVLLDLHMPGMDGFEMARRLRSGGFRAPVLGFSASSSERNLELPGGQEIPEGFDGFLDKNGRIEELHATLLGFLGEAAPSPASFLAGLDALLEESDPAEQARQASRLLGLLDLLEPDLGKLGPS